MVEVLYHIADIHIPNNISRHEEYNEVFKEVYKKLKEDEKEKLIVICGDLFHDKTMIKPEALILAKDFIYNLSKYGEIIIIDGNHDININNDDRKSTIEAMINRIETDNKIHYLKENKIYKIKGINFGLTTMYSKEVTKIGNKNNKERYIGLYHGTLYKSKTDGGHEFIDEKIFKSSDFNEYDITLLGDIHKYQYLNKKKTIAYSSSLIQQNFGESEKEHGMLKWNIKTLGSEFIEIENKNVFKTHKIKDIEDNKIDGIEDKVVKLRLKYYGKDREKIKQYETIIKKKYNLISITNEEIYDEIETKNDSEEEILNKKIIDVYNEFIKKNNLEENKAMKDKILEILDEEEIQEKKIKKIIKIKEIEFENLFTYGNKNKINFEKLEGLNIIIGNNGLGKSSIVDIILFTLYNKFSRGEGKEALNIRHDHGKSILKIELNNIEYTIKRSINNNRTEIKLLENDINISEDGKIRTDKKIIELFGTYEDMIMTSIILQVGNNFIDIDDKDKKDILINILGLNIYDNIYTKCKKEHGNLSSFVIKNIENTLTNKDYLVIIKDIEEKIEFYKEDIDSLIEEKENINNEEVLIKNNFKLNKCENIEEIIKKQKYIEKEILEKKEIVKNQYSKYKNINADNEKDKIITKTEKINNKIKSLSMKIIQTNVCEKDYEKKLEKIKNLQNELKEITLIIKKKNKLVDDIMIASINVDDINYKSNLVEEIKRKELEINKIKSKLENKKSNIKLLENLESKNNLLLNHKFNEKCKECQYNKLIHEKIGYKNEILLLKQKIIDNNTNENELEEYEERLQKIIRIKELLNDLELIDNKKEIINEKILYENILLEKIKKEIEIKKDNIIYENKILKYQEELQENKQEYKNLSNYITINEKINILYNDNENLKKIIENNHIFIEDVNRLNELHIIKKDIDECYKKYKKIYDNLILEKNILNNEYEKQILLLKDYEKNNKIKSTLKDILNLYDRGFREYILIKKINIFESKINNIIRNLSNYEIKIEVDKNNVKFYKIIDNKLLNVRKLCGYERIVFNVGFRLALNNMNVMTKNNFIIIDEGFSSSDQNNLQKIPYLLDVIKKEYEIGIIISHIDEIKNQDGKIINILFNDITKDSLINIV
jgi:DNA repair exonuclease SbcCD ATPase subunit